MGAPIVMQQQKNPFEAMLLQLYLGKIEHNYKMDLLKEQTKLTLAEEKREEQADIREEKRKEQARIETEKRKEIATAKEKGWREPGNIQDKATRMYGKTRMIGGRLMFYPVKPTTPKGFTAVWEDNEWNIKATPTGIIEQYNMAVKQGYKGSITQWKKEVAKAGAPQISIGEKQKQKDVAYLNSPKFIADVTKDVSQLNKFDWDLWDQNQRDVAIKREADKRVRINYPNAQYGVQNGKTGWYVKEGDRYELVTPWSK